MAEKYVTGLDGKFYIGAPGAPATTLLEPIKNVKVAYSKKFADTTTRASGKHESAMPTLRVLEISFTLLNRKGNTAVQTVLNKFLADPDEAMAVRALDEASGVGPDADFWVEAIPRDESNDEVQSYDVKLKVCDVYRAPTWH